MAILYLQCTSTSMFDLLYVKNAFFVLKYFELFRIYFLILLQSCNTYSVWNWFSHILRLER